MRALILAVAFGLVGLFWFLVAQVGLVLPVIGLLAVLVAVCAVCAWLVGRREEWPSPLNYDPSDWEATSPVAFYQTRAAAELRAEEEAREDARLARERMQRYREAE